MSEKAGLSFVGLCHKCYSSGVAVVLDEETAMMLCARCSVQTSEE